jgi:hypothetical protein
MPTSERLVDQKLGTAIQACLRRAGVHPALVHAFRRTFLLVTPFNLETLPLARLAEWRAAVAEVSPEVAMGEWLLSTAEVLIVESELERLLG